LQSGIAYANITMNFCPGVLFTNMNNLKCDEGLFWDSHTDSEPVVRLLFDDPDAQSDSLFGAETKELGSVVKLFPDEPDGVCLFDLGADLSQPIIRLLPDNPSEEAVLRLRVQLLEAKLARQNAQKDFSERIDVDHLEWRRQQYKIQHLQVGNVMLMVLSLALMICAGCLAVIR
jgi:hypothetical protein